MKVILRPPLLREPGEVFTFAAFSSSNGSDVHLINP